MASTITAEWQAKGGRALLEYLAEHGAPVNYKEIIEVPRERLQPSGEALDTVSNGAERWWNLIAWGATDQSAAGWIEKSGRGIWSITDAGRQALIDHPDPYEMRQFAQRAYRIQYNARPTRRAWLVRGASALDRRAPCRR